MFIINDIKKYIQSSVNFFSIFIALVPSIFLWVLQPDSMIHTWIFVITLYFCFFFLWLLAITILNSKEKSYNINLSTIKFTNNIFLCEPNKAIAHDSIISIYLKEDGFEHLIGYGIVINIQNDGYIQIEPHMLSESILNSENEFITSLKAINNIVIKPTVTKKIINELKY